MNLTTQYLGLTLKTPLIAGASPLTSELRHLRHLASSGAGAVVLPSIFEEQIDPKGRQTSGVETPARKGHRYHIDPVHYLDLVRNAARSINIPVIASLNCVTDHGWIDYAKHIEAAGAAALELNIYLVPANVDVPGHEIEQRYVNVLKAVKQAVTIPVAVKINPYFSSVGHMALQLERAGADGLILFNRLYEPDINVFDVASHPAVVLSQPDEIRLPLFWMGLLHGRTGASLAASTGVETAVEVVKYLLAGADVVMTASALLRHGPEHMRALREGLELWLTSHDTDSLESMRGTMSQRAVTNPESFVRANYIEVLQSSSTWV